MVRTARLSNQLGQLALLVLASGADRSLAAPVIQVDPQGLGATDVWLSNSTLLQNPVSSPATLWASNHAFRVGRYGLGDLLLAGGAQAEHRTVWIGEEVGSAGRVSIEDVGTVWQPGSALNVGRRGEGYLSITGGAETIATGSVYIAGGELSRGEVLVSGHGSKLTLVDYRNDSTLNVGSSGYGKLIIQDHATAETDYLDVGGSAGARFDLTDGSSMDVSRRVRVGVTSDYSGQMLIDSASTLRSGYASVSGKTGSYQNATATVEGPGTAWHVQDGLSVGEDGSGLLSVGSGGLVTSMSGYIGGYYSSESGRVDLDGAGTTWSIGGKLTLSNGALRASSGAGLSSQSAIIGVRRHSTASVVGEGSRWKIDQQLNFGDATATLEIGAGASIEVGTRLTIGGTKRSTDVLRFLVEETEVGGEPATGSLVVGDPDVFGSGVLEIANQWAELSIDINPDVALAVGDRFELIDYEALSGVFSVRVGDELTNLEDEDVWLLPTGQALEIDYDADLDGDGDLGVVVSVVGFQSGLPGDFNADGRVDGGDYTVWRDNLGAADESGISWGGDGVNGVDDADRELWVANYGRQLAIGAPVPEPAAGAMLLLASLTPYRQLRLRNRLATSR